MCDVVKAREQGGDVPRRMLLAAVASMLAVQGRICEADEVTGMETFSSAGKGLPILNGYKEAELLRRRRPGLPDTHVVWRQLAAL